jgi:hypothetical protein
MLSGAGYSWSGSVIGTEMGSCCAHGYGPWCWHEDPRVDWLGYPVVSGAPRRRRRYDEESLAEHLQDLEEEVREVRRLLEDLRVAREGGARP